MKKKVEQDKKTRLRASLTHLVTAGATLCTTLMVLGVFDSGTGPKVPPARGE